MPQIHSNLPFIIFDGIRTLLIFLDFPSLSLPSSFSPDRPDISSIFRDRVLSKWTGTGNFSNFHRPSLTRPQKLHTRTHVRVHTYVYTLVVRERINRNCVRLRHWRVWTGIYIYIYHSVRRIHFPVRAGRVRWHFPWQGFSLIALIN